MTQGSKNYDPEYRIPKELEDLKEKLIVPLQIHTAVSFSYPASQNRCNFKISTIKRKDM